VGDVAERDLLGRVTRTSLPFKPLEDAEGKEPPLITVARKAFERLRKKQRKDEEQREKPDPFEVEIVVAESGEVEVVEQEPPEERDYEIKVELDAAAKELLKAMEESGKQSWTAATVTISADRVEAAFSYPDLPDAPEPRVIEVELPEPSAPAADGGDRPQVAVPEIDAGLDEPADFDPAFHPRALGDDFAPGVHDPQGRFMPKEVEVAKRLEQAGWRIDARLADHGSGETNPDAMLRKSPGDQGVQVEFKTLENGKIDTVKRNILAAGKQVRRAGGEVVIDGRNVDLGPLEAQLGYRRAARQPGTTVAAVVHLILGDGRLITYTKEH
jgi:hypothetical protein